MLARTRRFILHLAMLLVLTGGGTRLHAQAVSGTIVGTVTDSAGASVANAQVSIVLTGQSTTYTSVSNESGNFTEPNLPSGTYSVTVAAPGFKKETRENIAVLTNQTTRVDLSLSNGSSSETVTVTAAPPLLQTDRADISSSIEQRSDLESSAEQREQLSIPAEHGAGHGAGRLQQLAVL